MVKKKTGKVVLISIGIALACTLAGGCIYLNSLMCIITGYAAKNLCSAVFVSGRAQEDVEAMDLNFSFIKYNRNKVDYEGKTVTSRFLWGKSTALYREGYGVTLVRGKKLQDLREEKFPLPVEPSFLPDTIDWPLGNRIVERDEALEAALSPLADAFVEEKAYGGNPFALVVLHGGIPVVQKYAPGFGADMKLLSWSMAKSFTGALCGIMAGDGMVDIDEPMDIPEWKDDGRRDITLSDMLHMCSGLEWNEDYGNRSDVNLMLHREKDMGLFMQDKPLRYEVGKHWYYSSGSTNLVMRYLRSFFLSDREFLAYIRDRLFAPIGIYDPVFEVDMSGTPVGSSYLYIRPLDYARFGQLFLDGGVFAGERILPEGWTDYSATPVPGSEGRYGAYFWLNASLTWPDIPSDMYLCRGHDGQEICIIPSKDLVVVILGYSPKPDGVIDLNGFLRDLISLVDKDQA